MNSEEKIKYIEIVQNLITRMNANSFQCKTMFVTIISALLAIYATIKADSVIYIIIIPTLIFWYLDSYYLSQERKIRELYKEIIGVESLELKKNKGDLKVFDIDLGRYKYNCSHCPLRVAFSRTIFFLYVMPFILIFIYYIFKLDCK